MEGDWAWLQPSWAHLESWQQRQQPQAEADCGSWDSSAACSCCGHSSSDSGDGEWLTGAPSFDDTWPEQVELVPTRFGPLRVTISGDRRNHPLFTYHDIALDHSSCFGALFRCPDTAPLLRQHFCVFHVDAPDHEVGAASGRQQRRKLSADDLAEQVADAITHFGLPAVTGLGVTAGAYVLTLLAIKRPELVRALILVSPVCRTPTWSEWAFNKVRSSRRPPHAHLLPPLAHPSTNPAHPLCQSHTLSRLSLFQFLLIPAPPPPCATVLWRAVAAVGAVSIRAARRCVGRLLWQIPQSSYAHQERHTPHMSVACGSPALTTDAALASAEEGEERDPRAVAQYADAFNNRRDITEQVRRITCACLVLVGEHSAFRDDALHLHAHLPPHLAAWFQVPASGSLPSFRPEDLSLDAIGCKLKPIRTRMPPGLGGVSKVLLPRAKPGWC
ncbi:unnamed protein product [Closterium sp. Naga37s-1]|nr:unnamed protein product [Closterium sp. Naga37s-1]